MSGRVALVTGGGQGIGRAIVDALAERGCAVAIADVRGDGADAAAAAVIAAGGSAMGIAMDVCDAGDVHAAVAATTTELGPIAVLVNCAGWDDLRPFLDTDEAFWERVIDVNFKGCMRTTQAVLPAMIAAGYGRVVNIGSDAGRVGSSLESVYSGAKGAVIAFTKTIAREVARDGVTVNVVCPGPTRTPLLDGMVSGRDDADKVIAAMTRAVPMKRLGEPDEVAAAVAFLASEQAGFITGQTLSVSGGLTMA
jgi:2-hydroxycyclohexanecarboxyl-CoA dehydrogenase